MSNAESDVGRGTWQDRLPWLLLLRVFRASISARNLFCASAGLLGTIAGWRLIWSLFASSKDPWLVQLRKSSAIVSTGTAWPAWPWETPIAALGSKDVGCCWIMSPSARHDVAASLADMGTSGLVFSLLCCLWAVAVWAFFGGMIARSVALRLTREESASWKQVAQFARSRWLSYFSAPFYPVLGILLIMLPLMALGLIARVGIGALLAGLLWPLALLGGLLMAILLLGLIFGWPLMWSTISVEGTDAFDALSRSYAYVFQRPLRYLFYAIVALVLGMLGWLLVNYFGNAVIHLTAWGVGWGASSEARRALLEPAASQSGLTDYGALLIAFWNSLVVLVVAAFPLSYFFSASTAIYLLLRCDVDAAELDEIHLDQEDTFGLPSLMQDDKGIPAAGDFGGSPTPPTTGNGGQLREEE